MYHTSLKTGSVELFVNFSDHANTKPLAQWRQSDRLMLNSETTAGVEIEPAHTLK